MGSNGGSYKHSNGGSYKHSNAEWKIGSNGGFCIQNNEEPDSIQTREFLEYMRIYKSSKNDSSIKLVSSLYVYLSTYTI